MYHSWQYPQSIYLQYNTVQYNTVLFTVQQSGMQNVDRALSDSQEYTMPPPSPWIAYQNHELMIVNRTPCYSHNNGLFVVLWHHMSQ